MNFYQFLLFLQAYNTSFQMDQPSTVSSKSTRPRQSIWPGERIELFNPGSFWLPYSTLRWFILVRYWFRSGGRGLFVHMTVQYIWKYNKYSSGLRTKKKKYCIKLRKFFFLCHPHKNLTLRTLIPWPSSGHQGKSICNPGFSSASESVCQHFFVSKTMV